MKAHARRLVFSSELDGQTDDVLVELSLVAMAPATMPVIVIIVILVVVSHLGSLLGHRSEG